MAVRTDLEAACDRLRALHVPGDPLVLPNAWDVASAGAVAAAGFPVVATTSGGVAATLGYEDHEGAPGDEMLAAAARIVGGVDVPVTVDAEAGYGMNAADLVQALRSVGAAGCNLEDTDHAEGRLREPIEQADWLRAVRAAADEVGYPLVINARIDVFLAGIGDGAPQAALLSDGLRRAHAYLEAGADCVYPIALWEERVLAAFLADAGGPVNLLAIDRAPSVPELAALGAARLSYGTLLHRDVMRRFADSLGSLGRDRA
jgi:2-methylisocitrate lyase-like PEP mutase family enzyme